MAIWFASNNKTNKKYIALFNLSDEIANISVNLEELDILKTEVTLTDLWTNNSSKNVNKIISKELAPHASAVYEIGL